MLDTLSANIIMAYAKKIFHHNICVIYVCCVVYYLYTWLIEEMWRESPISVSHKTLLYNFHT